MNSASQNAPDDREARFVALLRESARGMKPRRWQGYCANGRGDCGTSRGSGTMRPNAG